MKLRFVLALLLAVIPLAASAQDLYVEVPRVVAVGENFKVEFSAAGSNIKNMKDFVWAPGDGFEVVWGPMSGSSVQIVNGSKTMTKSYTYVLVADKAGTYTIPAASATVNGETWTSKPISIEVVDNGNASQSGSAQGSATEQASDQDVFLRLTLDKTNVVVGEPIIATLKLYTNSDLNGFESVSFPTFNGFWSQEIEAPVNLSFQRENLDGRLYQSALLRRYLLVPQQSGTITIDRAEMVAVLLVRSTPRSGASIFDSFFDNYQQKRKRIYTPELDVNVKPLPAGAPESFSGAVGNYNIKVSVDKDTLRQNEASSLKVELSGKGNLSLAGAPAVKLPSDFEQYDMKVSESPSVAKSMSGTKVFEFPFIPRSSGSYTIKGVEYTYYDVQKGRYITKTSEPIELYVIKDENSSFAGGPVSAGRKSVKNLNEDIRFIATSFPDLRKSGNVFVLSLPFYISVAAIFLLAVIAVAVGRRYIRISQDIRGQRNRKAEKMAMARLKVADTYLKQNLYSAFYDELHKALLGYISDKLMITAVEMSRDNIRGELLSHGVSEENSNRFMALLDACDFARYAPDSDSNAMMNHYNDAVAVISTIEGMISKKKKGGAQVLAALLLMVSISANAKTDSLQTVWDSANNAYTNGEWQEAVDMYDSILSMDLESAELYYNLGNAYFKMGNLSACILNYERALRLDPSDKDIAANLEMARNLTVDRIEQVPQFILASWVKDISGSLGSNAWAYLFLAMLVVIAVIVCIFLLGRSRGVKKTAFISFFPAIVFALVFLSFSLMQRADYLSEDSAIVVSSVSSVRSSPSDDNTKSLFILHEGTCVSIIENLGQWVRVEIADGRQGWIEKADIEII